MLPRPKQRAHPRDCKWVRVECTGPLLSFIPATSTLTQSPCPLILWRLSVTVGMSTVTKWGSQSTNAAIMPRERFVEHQPWLQRLLLPTAQHQPQAKETPRQPRLAWPSPEDVAVCDGVVLHFHSLHTVEFFCIPGLHRFDPRKAPDDF